jgi:hypothetical protein
MIRLRNCLRRREQRDGVVVALAHLAAVQAGQGRDGFVDHHFRQHEVLAIDVVETGGEIARHLQVLDLVAADRHLVGLEHQDVGGHQHRVHVQAGVDAGVGIQAFGVVAVHRRLVGVRAVEQALAGHAGQQPGELGNLRHVGLAVEGDLVRIQPAGKPGGGDFQRRTLHALGILHLHQRVVVGEEVEAVDVAAVAGGDGRADRAGVVAEVGGAGGGDSGQDALLRHGRELSEGRPSVAAGLRNPESRARAFVDLPSHGALP